MENKIKVSYRIEKSVVTGKDVRIMVVKNYVPDPSQLSYAESMVQQAYDFGGRDQVTKNLLAANTVIQIKGEDYFNQLVEKISQTPPRIFDPNFIAPFYVEYDDANKVPTPAKAKKEVAGLRKELEYHEKLYYTDPDNVEISDYEYDMKMKRLEQLEEWFPQYSKGSSPSVRVGFTGSETQANLESNLENL
ncbi:hypothetical protein CMI47_17225 [Candidatus Pacearchaeota archaeon]|jgi:hypothetical protein|nr:hypothetical protein [Candidatus Pacearchaeota archaeon]|tara:strand:+ start:987 stop:1559 length:573 start_codon:yes stop_codon:yes gene_type:complete